MARPQVRDDIAMMSGYHSPQLDVAIRLNTIVSFEAFDDGVEVRRASGKPLTFALNLRDEWFARLFARVRRDAG